MKQWTAQIKMFMYDTLKELANRYSNALEGEMAVNIFIVNFSLGSSIIWVTKNLAQSLHNN